ncbi:FHA domain-containing protein, partial [Singulisphaera rosea]
MRVTLRVTQGPHAGRSFEFQQHDTFIVGRAVYAHFRLEQRDKYFSRAHFLVEVNPPLCRLMDLGSTNGTFVNGKKVGEVDLGDGDKIRGGITVLEVGIDRTGAPDETKSFLAVEPRPRPRPRPPERERLQTTPPLASPPGLDPVERIGRYWLVRQIGRGGMGVVHLAVREGDRRQV